MKYNLEMEGERKNPNSIGSMLAFKEGVPTSSDKVYRSVNGDKAIHDLFEHGEIRNRAAATGALEKSRWNDTVYWSRGEDGKFHPVSEGTHVIEAPHEVATKGPVRNEDVTGIYTRTPEGEVVNQIEQIRARLGMQGGRGE